MTKLMRFKKNRSPLALLDKSIRLSWKTLIKKLWSRCVILEWWTDSSKTWTWSLIFRTVWARFGAWDGSKSHSQRTNCSKCWLNRPISESKATIYDNSRKISKGCKNWFSSRTPIMRARMSWSRIISKMPKISMILPRITLSWVKNWPKWAWIVFSKCLSMIILSMQTAMLVICLSKKKRRKNTKCRVSSVPIIRLKTLSIMLLTRPTSPSIVWSWIVNYELDIHWDSEKAKELYLEYVDS